MKLRSNGIQFRRRRCLKRYNYLVAAYKEKVDSCSYSALGGAKNSAAENTKRVSAGAANLRTWPHTDL